MEIDLFHDTACPWCRIGKKHLALALKDIPNVTVRYRTFFLNPDIPAEGFDFRSYMTAKGGGNPNLEMWFDAPRRMGAQVGLTFNFEKITKAPNTLLSHQLIALAPDDRRPALVDAVYDAYFEHGRDIGDLAVLESVAAEVGLDAPALAEALRRGERRDEVLAEAAWGQQLGVTGVPLFLFAGRYGVSGAQPPDVLRQVIDRVAAVAAQG